MAFKVILKLRLEICLLTAENALFEFCILRRNGAILSIVSNFLDLKCYNIYNCGLKSNSGRPGRDLGMKYVCFLLKMHNLNFAKWSNFEHNMDFLDLKCSKYMCPKCDS